LAGQVLPSVGASFFQILNVWVKDEKDKRSHDF
jgi:hypothetical protein